MSDSWWHHWHHHDDVISSSSVTSHITVPLTLSWQHPHVFDLWPRTPVKQDLCWKCYKLWHLIKGDFTFFFLWKQQIHKLTTHRDAMHCEFVDGLFSRKSSEIFIYNLNIVTKEKLFRGPCHKGVEMGVRGQIHINVKLYGIKWVITTGSFRSYIRLDRRAQTSTPHIYKYGS